MFIKEIDFSGYTAEMAGRDIAKLKSDLKSTRFILNNWTEKAQKRMLLMRIALIFDTAALIAMATVILIKL